MFAAIPNFKAFYSESGDVTGPECLRLLNEIISSFDTVGKSQYSMAANERLIMTFYCLPKIILVINDPRNVDIVYVLCPRQLYLGMHYRGVCSVV